MGTRHCGRRRAEHTPVVKTTATTVYTGTVRGTEVHIAMYNFSDKVVAAATGAPMGHRMKIMTVLERGGGGEGLELD